MHKKDFAFCFSKEPLATFRGSGDFVMHVNPPTSGSRRQLFSELSDETVIWETAVSHLDGPHIPHQGLFHEICCYLACR